MADNVTLNSGSGGAVLATDDIGSVHYQRVKVTYGTDGSATDVSDSNPMPVDDAGGSLTVDNPALSVTGGGVEASALRVTLASDSTGVLSVDDNGSTLSVDDGGSSITVDNAALSVTGGGVEASALRVTIASDSTGVLSVDDGGASLTIDGTVTAELSATDNAVLDSIAASGVTIAGAVSGSEMQVDVVGSLPAGTNAIGKLSANSGVDIGDVDVTSIAAGSNLIGDVGIGVRTSGGTSLFRSIDLDETQEQVKGSAGQVYWIHAMNLKASKLYLKFYNATSASVTVGTTTPVATFALPTPGDTNGAGFTLSIPNGIAFSTAITVACTTGLADNDTGAPGANECIVHIGYA